MENVLLIIHLILAVFLIAVVLLQRSEGGALGIGGGGGGGISSRPPTTPLAKATWVLAGAFIVTSLALTIIAAQESGSRSVLDQRMDLEQGPEDVAPQEDDALDPDLERLLTPPPAADEPAGGAGAPAGGGGSPAPVAPPAAE